MDPTTLSTWLRMAAPLQREELAAAADISVNYLYLMAGGHRNNFRLRMAFRLSKKSYEMHLQTLCFLPWITIEDLYAITDRTKTKNK